MSLDLPAEVRMVFALFLISSTCRDTRQSFSESLCNSAATFPVLLCVLGPRAMWCRTAG